MTVTRGSATEKWYDSNSCSRESNCICILTSLSFTASVSGRDPFGRRWPLVARAIMLAYVFIRFCFLAYATWLHLRKVKKYYQYCNDGEQLFFSQQKQYDNGLTNILSAKCWTMVISIDSISYQIWSAKVIMAASLWKVVDLWYASDNCVRYPSQIWCKIYHRNISDNEYIRPVSWHTYYRW